jgi:uncharacterized membrane protein
MIILTFLPFVVIVAIIVIITVVLYRKKWKVKDTNFES